MADQGSSTEWVRSPAANAAVVEIRVPEGAELDPALRASLDEVIAQLQQGLEGDSSQQGMVCTQGNCKPMASGECAWFVSCRIG